jgi:hypothetical protein
MEKQEYIKKAIEIYRENDKKIGRDTIGNEDRFSKWAGEQYDAGVPLDEILY